MQSGVPSILGSILILIYINDLPHSIVNLSTYLFADDTKFINTSSDFSLLQSDITSLQQWCCKWKLNLNLSKCVCLQLNFSNSLPESYVMHTDSDTLQLSSPPCHCELGIIVCNNLSWSAQYKSMCSSAYRTLNFIKRLLQGSPASISLRNPYISHLYDQKYRIVHSCGDLTTSKTSKFWKIYNAVQQNTFYMITHPTTRND